jgi:hypothetical protein
MTSHRERPVDKVSDTREEKGQQNERNADEKTETVDPVIVGPALAVRRVPREGSVMLVATGNA